MIRKRPKTKPKEVTQDETKTKIRTKLGQKQQRALINFPLDFSKHNNNNRIPKAQAYKILLISSSFTKTNQGIEANPNF